MATNKDKWLPCSLTDLLNVKNSTSGKPRADVHMKDVARTLYITSFTPYNSTYGKRPMVEMRTSGGTIEKVEAPDLDGGKWKYEGVKEEKDWTESLNIEKMADSLNPAPGSGVKLGKLAAGSASAIANLLGATGIKVEAWSLTCDPTNRHTHAQRLFFCFRGTENVSNAFQDLAGYPVRIPDYFKLDAKDQGGWIHSGFEYA